MKNKIHVPNPLKKYFQEFILLAIIIISLGIAGFAEAQQNKMPTLINPQTLKSWQYNTGKVILIDLRSVLECMDAKISDSLCLSGDDEKDGSVLDSLAKDIKIVLYGGSKPVDSECGPVSRALSRKFTSVYILAGGIPAWRQAGYPVVSEKRIPRVISPAVNPGNFSEWQKQAKNLLVIDIRSAKAYAAGHLAGAQNFPLTRLHVQYADIPWERKMLIVDEDGTRSFLAASYLAHKGFADIQRLKGGMAGYRRGMR